MKHESSSAFLNATALEPAHTMRELRLPSDMGAEYCQPYNIPMGSELILLDDVGRKFGNFRSAGVQTDDIRGRVHVLQNTLSENTALVSDYQLAEMEKAKRFFPREENPDWEVSDVALTPEKKDKAERNLAYAVAIRDLAAERGVEAKRGLMEEAAAKLAVSLGEPKPPTYNTLKKYYEIYISGPYNLLAALAPGSSSGNKNRGYSDRFEQLLRACCHMAWQQPKGTWRTVKRIFLKQLEKPEFADIAVEVLDADGQLTCADITIQRRFYAVDRYTRKLLRYGGRAAKRLFDGRTRRPLPDVVLDEVEVDYTTVDANVWSDDAPIAFGRPKILLFRDRKSGVLLGYHIFFGNPSLEAFLAGLHHAIYPKDMTRFPGYRYPYFGKPLVLIFDNDSHLLTDDVKHACDVLGIVHRAVRPGEPTDKGAVERFIRTLNDYLFHNVPGSTQSNPKRRNLFDKDKQMAVPQLKLSELEAFLVAFICGEYHVHPVGGLGLTRVMKDVPAYVWSKSILDVKMRPPVNPQTFIALAGHRKKVTIQNGMVRWDYLTYAHPDLAMLETRPEHRAAEPGVATTTYDACRSFLGIDRITLIDHFSKRTIEVPICDGDRAYATGKRLFQHEAALKKYRAWLKKEPLDTVDLQRAFDAHISDLDQMHAVRNSQKTAEALAAFHHDMLKKRRTSRVVEVAHSAAASAKHINYEDPLKPEPVASGSMHDAPTNPPSTPREVYVPDENGNLVKSDPLAESVPKRGKSPPEPVEIAVETDPDDDLDALLDKWKGYDK